MTTVLVVLGKFATSSISNVSAETCTDSLIIFMHPQADSDSAASPLEGEVPIKNIPVTSQLHWSGTSFTPEIGVTASLQTLARIT